MGSLHWPGPTLALPGPDVRNAKRLELHPDVHVFCPTRSFNIDSCTHSAPSLPEELSDPLLEVAAGRVARHVATLSKQVGGMACKRIPNARRDMGAARLRTIVLPLRG
jgi:hypothetical protein